MGQLMFATVATQAARNSLGTSGPSRFTISFTGAGVSVTTGVSSTGISAGSSSGVSGTISGVSGVSGTSTTSGFGVLATAFLAIQADSINRSTKLRTGEIIFSRIKK